MTLWRHLLTWHKFMGLITFWISRAPNLMTAQNNSFVLRVTVVWPSFKHWLVAQGCCLCEQCTTPEKFILRGFQLTAAPLRAQQLLIVWKGGEKRSDKLTESELCHTVQCESCEELNVVVFLTPFRKTMQVWPFLIKWGHLFYLPNEFSAASTRGWCQPQWQ